MLIKIGKEVSTPRVPARVRIATVVLPHGTALGLGSPLPTSVAHLGLGCMGAFLPWLPPTWAKPGRPAPAQNSEASPLPYLRRTRFAPPPRAVPPPAACIIYTYPYMVI